MLEKSLSWFKNIEKRQQLMQTNSLYKYLFCTYNHLINIGNDCELFEHNC